jgi:hypothetical protein
MSVNDGIWIFIGRPWHYGGNQHATRCPTAHPADNLSLIDQIVSIPHGIPHIQIFEVIVVVLLAALGINLVSSGIESYFQIKEVASITFGFLIIMISIVSLVFSPGNSLRKQFKFSGVVVFDKNEEFIEVDRYDFSDEFLRFTKALSAENKALESLIKCAKSAIIYENNRSNHNKKLAESNKLIVEIVEYYFLSELSNHLQSYFNNESDFPKEYVQEITRKDIPGILLQNRALELFSRPMRDREAFMEFHGDEDEDDLSAGQTVYAFGKDGQMFSKFDLNLPRGTIIERRNEGSIDIKHDFSE